ncbi:MAG: L-threonylcarbamoyladenylate synthase [bacterium]
MEKVKTWIVRREDLDRNLARIAERVADGAIVVYPTDTVYGIGASPARPESIKTIYRIKRRTLKKPMALLINDAAKAGDYAVITSEAKRLMERFWPGPLTIVFPAKKGAVPAAVNNAGDSIGIRMPSCETSLSLIAACGGVLATTSANTSSMDDAVTFETARAYFDGTVEIMIDGGNSPVGIPSTVVSCADDGVAVIREGFISEARIRECCS